VDVRGPASMGLDHPGVVAWIQQRPDSDGLTAAGRITFSSPRWLGLSEYLSTVLVLA